MKAPSTKRLKLSCNGVVNMFFTEKRFMQLKQNGATILL
jgi:hypothetical protein